MHLRAKFEVFSIILTRFGQGVILPPPPTSKRTPKNPTYIKLKELQKDDKLRVYKFDKGCRFTIVTNDTAKEKIEAQLGKATKAKIGSASRFTKKIQKKKKQT